MAKTYLDPEGLSNLIDVIKILIADGNVVNATGDGAAYTATVPGVSSLKNGITITIIPNKTSTATIPTLNVNGLGAKSIKQKLSLNTALTTEAVNESWMVANKPITLQYNGSVWTTIAPRASATDIYGTVAIDNGGTGADTAPAALVNLGAQAQHTPVTVTLPASGWTNNRQTVTVSGVTADNTVIPGPAPASHMAYAENGVYCSAQGKDSLTFTCDYVPDDDLTINVAIFKKGGAT